MSLLSRSLSSLGLIGAGVVLLGGTLFAQQPDKDAQAKDALKGELLDSPRLSNKSTLIRSGYTRPGNPSDMIKDGKVIALAWDDDYKGRYIGATVYFAVYERGDVSAPGDAFGTGYPGIDEMFKEGRGNNGRYSPGYDTNARYLYVYQVVNDRGLDPKKEVPIGAPWRNFRSEDIVTATVKLLVDPHDITSWGHFSNTAFAARVTDRNLRGKEQLAADGKSDRVLLMALSANPSVLGALQYHEYLAISPALPLHSLKNNFGPDRGNLNLNVSAAYKELNELKNKGVKLVAWQDNMLIAGKGAREPAYVQIDPAEAPAYGPMLYADGAAELFRVGQNPARAYLRVDWRDEQIIKLGEHSVVFGFTSNLPPADEVVRVVSAPKITEVGDGSDQTVSAALIDGDGPGVGPGQVVGPGTVPTPVPMPMGGACVSGGWLAGPVGGFGGGFGLGRPFGAFGGFWPAPFGGGGGGSGAGSGSSNQAQNQNQNQNQNQQQSQSQQQSQQQSQSQSQSQNQEQVVPEPTSIILGLAGLPALYLALRRRKSSQPELAPNS
jgi:hypothetical protein